MRQEAPWICPMFWKKLSADERRQVVFAALERNTSYDRGHVLGYPGSFLDREVFPRAPFLANAPFLSCLIENPNHIGCHTLGDFEPTFQGTQEIERELVAICAEQILGGGAGQQDGYVASGGTESNIQALWIFRNQLREKLGARCIGVLRSQDTHYSIPKACNLLGLVDVSVAVDEDTRRMSKSSLREAVGTAREQGVEALIVVLNMGTTMFGSVDAIDPVIEAVEAAGLEYRAHVDAAFGGFIYPLTTPDNPLSFRDKRISSVTLDAHKMLQAPYGTGIFLARQGLMQHVQTKEARYVPGTDYTLCGSRSGANAVAVWMILKAYGSEGGREFAGELMRRTDRLCQRLDERGLRYFREPGMNVVALRAEGVPPEVAERYQLVPDRHSEAPRWWKIVVMDHVTDSVLSDFLAAL